MSKSRVNIQETPLDPFAFEKSIGAPTANTPYQNVSNGLEFVTEAPVEDGQSSLGNSRYAQQALLNYKTEQQGALELIAKGVGRTIAKTGTEILKTPGYIGGAIGAINNEVFGDGKDSMSLMVDNAWINAFEKLDEQTKALMPVHISQEVQSGNILDKMSSGAWWATQGSDGVGFMLSMFVPGAIAKIAGSGKAVAGLAEVIANTRAGKLLAAPKIFGLSPEVAELAGKYREGQAWINGADGIVAASVNTGLEAAAEAAGMYDDTYKGLKDKVKAGEMSDDRAKEIAGTKASASFKSNIGLLMVSNLLEQAWVWKAFGSNADSVITKAFKDGKLDYNVLRSLGNKEFKEALKEYGSAFLKNSAKEGIFEEGSQSQIEQDINSGKTDGGLLGGLTSTTNLLKNIFGGEDDFWKNTEMHEAMVLGSVLGAGMGFVEQIKENNNLDRFLNGYSKAQSENTWYNKLLVKSGVKQNRPDSVGIIKLLEDNFIKNFKGDLTNLQTDGKLDPNKMYQAWEQGKKEEYIHAMYDAAVATNDEIGRQKWGLLIAQNYTQPFLGQQGMEKIFEDHVKNQLTPVWQDRFEKQNKREASKEEVDQFQSDFIQSGKSVFDAYNEATRTNYPERYVKPEQGTTDQYARFRQQYMNIKLQTLLEFESLKTVETKVNEEFRKQGLESKVERLENFNYKINGSITAQEGKQIQDYFKLLKEIEKKKGEVNQNYELLFDKKVVQELYQSIIDDKTDVEEELAKDTTKKKEEVKEVVTKIEEKEKEIVKASEPTTDIEDDLIEEYKKIIDKKEDIKDKPIRERVVMDNITPENKTLGQLIGKKVLYKNQEYVLGKTDGGQFYLEDDDKIIEISGDENTFSNFKNISEVTENVRQSKYSVQIIDENKVIVNKTEYTINRNNSQRIISLSPVNKSGQEIKNEKMLIAVEIELSKQDHQNLSKVTDKQYQDIKDSIPVLKEIEKIFSYNFSESVDKSIDKIYENKELSPDERLDLETWVFGANRRLQKLISSGRKEQEIVNALETVKIIDNLLKTQNYEQFENININESVVEEEKTDTIIDKKLSRTTKRKKVPVKNVVTGEKKELTVVDTPEGTRIGELSDEGFIELRPEDFTDFQVIDEVAQDAVKDIDMSDFQMIEGTQVDLTPSSNLPVEEPTTETESLVRQEIGRLPTNDKHTSGLHVAYTFNERYTDNLTPDGLPVLGTESQQRWFNTVNSIDLSDAYTVVVYPYSEIRKNEQLFSQISREISGVEIKENDLWSVLYKNGKPVMDESNFVFTSIQRPETVYQGSNLRVANKYIDEFPGKDFNEKKNNAEQEYRKWYNSFTSPTELSIMDRARGHMLMRRDSNGDPIWNKASTNIPELVNRLEVSETGEVVVGGNVFKIQKGDVVAISDFDNVYPLRSRDLNNEEVNVIISMLDMLNTQSVSDVQLNINIPITDVKSRNSIGVFTDSDVPLFNYLTRFSKGEGGFYLEGNQIIYHPYGQEQRSILLSELRSDKGKDFRDFLLSKRKVYNKRISQRPAFTLIIKDGSIRSIPLREKFQDHAMQSDLLTLSVVAKGYPSRLQQNLYLGDKTGRNVNTEQSKVETPSKPANKYANRANKASKNLDADKVFSADEILQIKLQSGEITKTCK